MILLIAGEKGGTGKTTIATNLAATQAKKLQNYECYKGLLLIDTDKQSTASYWCAIRDDKSIAPRISSVQKFGKEIKYEVKQLQLKYDDIIIDAGGRDSQELRSSLLVADKVIIPLRPSQFDLWTLSRMNDLVSEARDFNSNLKAYVLINQASTHPNVKEVSEAQDMINEFNHLIILKSIICERISFRRAAINGMSVAEYVNCSEKSVYEINSLYNEIFNETI